MDRESVIKFHQTGKPQTEKGKVIVHNCDLDEDEIKPLSETSEDCTSIEDKNLPKENLHSNKSRLELEKQTSSISLEVQNSDSTIEFDYSFGTVSNDGKSNEDITNNDNIESYPCYQSHNTINIENIMHGNWFSDQPSYFPHPCYAQDPNHPSHHPHPIYQQALYPGNFCGVNHALDVPMRNDYGQDIYPPANYPASERGNYEFHEESALGTPAHGQRDEAQSLSFADSWYGATYRAPAPILQYWLVPASFANVFHYGPSHFTMPEPPNSVKL